MGIDEVGIDKVGIEVGRYLQGELSFGQVAEKSRDCVCSLHHIAHSIIEQHFITQRFNLCAAQ